MPVLKIHAEKKELRCPVCGWRLMFARGRAEIETKCKNCKRIVTVRVEEAVERKDLLDTRVSGV